MKQKNLPALFQVEKTLGPLEHKVMRAVWEKDKTTVREILLTFQNKRRLAYTTIMTVMDNLYKKGFLGREKIKKTYYYSPLVRESDILAFSLALVFKDLTKEFGKRKILSSVFNTSILPEINIKFNSSYSAPIGYGVSLTLLLFLFGLSFFDLGQNLSFFGTFDYLKLLTSDIIFSLDHLPVYISALFESLPMINVLTTITLFILLIIMVKKLSKLLNFRISLFTGVRGSIS